MNLPLTPTVDAAGLVRRALASDAGAVAVLHTEIARAFSLPPSTPESMRARIEKATALALPWLVSVDRHGEIDGSAFAANPQGTSGAYRSADTCVLVRHDARRRGVGKQLYRALLSALASRGYRYALAGITLPNPASVALHEAVGFEPLVVYPNAASRDGGRRDVGWWRRELESS